MTDVSFAGPMNSPALRLPDGVPAAILVATSLSEPAQKPVRDMLLLSLQMGATSKTIGKNSVGQGVPVQDFMKNIRSQGNQNTLSTPDKIATALGRTSYNDLANETVLSLLYQSPTAKKLAEFVVEAYSKEPDIMSRVLSEASISPYKNKADAVIVALDKVVTKDANGGKSESLNDLPRDVNSQLLYELHKVSSTLKLENGSSEENSRTANPPGSSGHYVIPLGLRPGNVYHPAFKRGF